MEISLKYVIKRAVKADKVFLVGAGTVGREILGILKDAGSVNISAVFDNNESLIESHIENIVVKKPYHAEGDRCIYLITVDRKRQQRELLAQLLTLGIQEKDIIIYNHYSRYNYLCTLEEKYYEEEVQEMYYEKLGKRLDWNYLSTYNEKIQWIKIHGITPMMTKLTDKYAVREWVKVKIGEKYLIPLIGVWDKFDDIDVEVLPERFALKCTHGCAWNEIVRDKRIWDIAEAKKKFERWMGINFAFKGALQMQYRDIVPHIIAEEYLENADGDLYDYKFWCMGGKVEFIMFLSERANGLKMNNYDRDWNLLPFTYNYPNSEKIIPRPEQLDKMIEIAERLAKGFPHVRVDLYQLNNGEIKFGEMTFTSCNGMCKWNTEDIDYTLGNLLHI